jgi:hypothetical protein
MPRKD